MHQPSLSGWTPGQPTAVIDLGEEFAPDPSNASTAALQFSAAYYAVDSSAEGNGSKKRKVERACDFCRRRKARCDGPRMPDNVCSNCITNSRSCTYLEGSKPRGPPKAYVVGLEDRVERMEALIKRLRPESDFSAELGPPVVRDSWKTEAAPPASSSDKARSNSPKAIAHSPALTKKQSLASLTAPPPNRACPSSSHQRDPSSKSRSASGKKPAKNAKARKSKNEDSASDHDASCSSLSDSSETDEAGELSITRGMKRLTLRGLEPTEGSPERYMDDNQLRFHGKSSSFKLISTTRVLMQQHMIETSSDGRQSNSPADTQLPPPSNKKRPEFWTLPPWEKAFENALDRTHIPDWVLPAFPPDDLAEKLINDFFECNNSTFTLLHRPTFERQWSERLYTQNAWFACICLAIFGIASRWTDDPRVIPDPVANMPLTDQDPRGEEGREGTSSQMWTLAGWGYIAAGMKIHEARRSVLNPPELFEIQSFALIAQYFRGTVAQCGSWFYLSVGLLKAQDVGAHRKKIYGRKPTVEEELWKRAYWHLVAFDRIGSMLIGRACCSREEDLDLDLPLEVDDEYWENDDPELAFRQPDGKPALVSCFVHWIKLSHIIAYALKTLYTPNRSKFTLGQGGREWKEQTVEKLNDALLTWLDELPPHLRWRPDMEDRIFASQAATLMTTYHLVQIVIYRPFIRIPRGLAPSRMAPAQHSVFSHKSLSICLNCARAASYILEIQTQRGMLNITNVLHVSFVCAGVLLVYLWDLIRQYGVQRGSFPAETMSPLLHEISSVMGEIEDTMARLEEVSDKWELAREMLDEINNGLPASASPTEDTAPKHLFPDVQGSVPLYGSAPVPVPSSHNPPPASHPHPQISPLTPPEHYDLHGYRQDYIHAPQARVSRPPVAVPVPPPGAPQHQSQSQHQPGPMAFSFDGTVHQLWDMDGAPASPPPLPDFNMFVPQQAPQHPQHPQHPHYVQAPPPPAHHKPQPPAIYTQSHHVPSISAQHRNSAPSAHHGYHQHSQHPHQLQHQHPHQHQQQQHQQHQQQIRPPQPHPIRTSLPAQPAPGPSSAPAYHDAYQQQQHSSAHSYGPRSASPTNPHPHPHANSHSNHNANPEHGQGQGQGQRQILPPEYRASYYKEEDEPLGDHECLRLRLLEETYGQGQRGMPPPSHPSSHPHQQAMDVNMNVTVPSQGAFGAPEQWANGGHRYG